MDSPNRGFLTWNCCSRRDLRGQLTSVRWRISRCRSRIPSRYADFVVPGCDRCDGTLKPDVVFFGENVPKRRVEECWRMVDRADLLLVVGSSLTVYSGRRFVYGAAERSLPIGVVNLGPTRADDLATAKVEAQLGNAMPRLVEALQPS